MRIISEKIGHFFVMVGSLIGGGPDYQNERYYYQMMIDGGTI